MSVDRVRVFKRLETDVEFRARINALPHGYVSGYHTGKSLDDVVWNDYRLQRKIIEDMR